MFKAFNHINNHLSDIPATRKFGKVTGVSGLIISCEGISNAAMGGRCTIELADKSIRSAEIVGFKDKSTLLMPFGETDGIGQGCKVYPTSQQPVFRANNSLAGRVINALGEPIDGKGPLALGGQKCHLKAAPPSAGKRNHVGGRMDLGVRAVNTFIPICDGQRIGIFSGSGVGKSVLMGMIAQFSDAEITVIGLVGERGREVREFIDEQLGPEGLAKSVVVVATGDEPPLMRRQAAYLTMTIAEYFRDCGFRVMLLLDSVTRFAMAQREIGLSAGEPPTTKGFTPSVFAELPRLLERAGPGIDKGSISAIFTVLVEGGDMDEPVADAVRGIVDGHIVMTRKLAERNHFPAVDVLQSISRMAPECNTDEENKAINKARALLSTYTDMEELIRLGAYTKGSDPQTDEAVERYEELSEFLKQHPQDHTSMAAGHARLKEIVFK